MNTPVRLVLACLLIGLIGACDRNWPPKKQRILEHFAMHQVQIEELASMLEESEYSRVHSGGWQQGSDEVPDSASAFIERDVGQERVLLTGEEAIAWNTAFFDARVWSIARDDRGVIIQSISVVEPGGSPFIAYLRPPEEENDWVECRDEFRQVRCGHCVVALDDGWWLNVGWREWPIDEEAMNEYIEGRMPEEELQAIEDELYEQCYREGAEVIGYPYPEPPAEGIEAEPAVDSTGLPE